MPIDVAAATLTNSAKAPPDAPSPRNSTVSQCAGSRREAQTAGAARAEGKGHGELSVRQPSTPAPTATTSPQNS